MRCLVTQSLRFLSGDSLFDQLERTREVGIQKVVVVLVLRARRRQNIFDTTNSRKLVRNMIFLGADVVLNEVAAFDELFKDLEGELKLYSGPTPEAQQGARMAQRRLRDLDMQSRGTGRSCRYHVWYATGDQNRSGSWTDRIFVGKVKNYF